jgi:hypothetical protein
VKEFWTYTALRVALLLGTAALVAGIYAAVAGSRPNLLVVVLSAAVISSLASWKLLSGPRERLAANVEARATRATERFEEIKSKEDAD